MAGYDMMGNGAFGGSSNFLSMLGGIGNDWGYGMASGIKMGTAMMNYNNAIATNPSALRANIAKNIAAQGQYEGEHYRNSMMNPMLSRLASGQELLDWQKRLIDGGYVQGIGNGQTGGMTGSVQGTPTNTNGGTPATQVATMPITSDNKNITVTVGQQSPATAAQLQGASGFVHPDTLRAMGGKW